LFIFMLGLVTVFYHFLGYVNTITLQENAKNTTENIISKLDEVRFSSMVCKEEVVPIDYLFRAGENNLPYLIRINKTTSNIGIQEETNLSIQIRNTKTKNLIGASNTKLTENEEVFFYKCPYYALSADEPTCQKQFVNEESNNYFEINPSEIIDGAQSSYIILTKSQDNDDETKQNICIADCVDFDQKICLKAIRNEDACGC
ncbi:MAG: hypothetical protein KAS30_03505, partial [Candidatus Diapherotrites archaeon]|nr:hypothetical protein [Candidatus Diapherotrites archaeon]